MKKVILIRMFFFLLLGAIFNVPAQVWAATYYIPTSTGNVDGRTYCGGKPCKGGDKLIVRGGTRKGLLLRNFNGNGKYITITNENSAGNKQVYIKSDGTGVGKGILSIDNCKYIDVRGDNDPDIEYGFRINNGGTGRSGSVWVYGKSEHVKIGYIEISFDGNRGYKDIGIQVQDVSLTSDWIFNDFEIHHNYIHDALYSAMYLGHNDAKADNNPYLANFSVHHNVMKNLGSYGVTLKGVMGPSTSYIYENLVDTTGLYDGYPNYKKQGIGSMMHYNGSTVKIYKNTVMNTVGPCLKFGNNFTKATNEAYENILLGCGTGNDKVYGNAIVAKYNTSLILNDNIIIQPARYGLLVQASAVSVEANRNKIGDAGLGKFYGTVAEGTGADANVYYANVKDFKFKTWRDDKNYYNDNFSLTGGSTASPILAPKDLKVESSQ